MNNLNDVLGPGGGNGTSPGVPAAPDGGSFPPTPNRQGKVFLRLPTREDRGIWPWDRLRNKKLQRAISPCAWNHNKPPVRAYSLCKTGAERGVVLIEHLDVIKFLNDGFMQESGALTPPIPLPEFFLPPVLSIPSTGQECPVTSLRHTIMFELSLPFSPYGRTDIHICRYLLPGSAVKHVGIETQSLLRYIRSLPPPRYTMDSGTPGPAIE